MSLILKKRRKIKRSLKKFVQDIKKYQNNMVQKLRVSTIYLGMSHFHRFYENADFSLDTVKASIKQARIKNKSNTKRYQIELKDNSTISLSK